MRHGLVITSDWCSFLAIICISKIATWVVIASQIPKSVTRTVVRSVINATWQSQTFAIVGVGVAVDGAGAAAVLVGVATGSAIASSMAALSLSGVVVLAHR